MTGSTGMEGTPIALNESMTREVIEKSIGLLEKKCIRLNGHEPNWRALFSEQLEEIARSKSPADFEVLVNKVMARGGLSHVAFFHVAAQPITRRAERWGSPPCGRGC